GAGSEDLKNYANCGMTFCDIENIHEMRASLDRLRTLCEAKDEDKFYSLLQQTRWLDHIRLILASSLQIVHYIEELKEPVVIHCSDGWDRTTQLSAIAQLLMDPYYRTIKGFRVLIQKEWLAFGHKFNDRYADATVIAGQHEERSPVFIQFIDCVWQIAQQF